MNLLKYIRSSPRGVLFDNAAIRLIVHWMHPLRLKAFGGFTAAAALLFVVAGCESDGETVPVHTAGPLPAAISEPRPILLAQNDVAPVKVDKPAAVADLSTNIPAAPTTAEATVKAMAAVGATNAPAATTNATPVISEEIPPARPANLKISESTEKIIKLTESNLDEKVILAFVQQTSARFELEADEIVYLSDVGVPSTVIAAMLKHDGDDPTKAEHLTAIANTENIQPAIPANTNLPSALAQAQPQNAPPVQGQAIEVTTNYVPNQQVVIQQAPPQTVVVEQQPTVVYSEPETVNYFYDSLSPYGSWFYASDYGWCWQPTVAVIDHGWRPYGPRGHWVWTDAGWYWSSDYTWGWAPFHYGRWQMAGARGWIWLPDRTWGPSWVTWRSSGDYCGWAPLPPHAVFRPGIGFTYFGRGVDVSFGFGLGYDAFCFAPVGRFHNRHVYDYCLPRHEVITVFPHSHVANRWEFRNDGHEWVNRAGPRLEQGLRPATVRTMSENDRSHWGNRERVERSNRETVIYRPPSPSASTGIAAGGGVTGGQRAGQNWSPRTRAEVSTRPSTSANGGAVPAGEPRTLDSRRGAADNNRAAGVISGPSTLSGNAAPTPVGQPRVLNPSQSRGDRNITRSPETAAVAPSRAVNGLGAPSTTTPSPTTGGSRPITSMPAPSTSTPGIGSTPETSSRVIRAPQGPAPRVAGPAGEPRVLNPATRRPLADASSAVTPLPGSGTFDNAPRATTTAEPAPSRREFSRPIITQPSTPTPQISTPAPTTIAPQIVSPPPRTVAPAPQTVAPAPRIIAPPPSTPAPTRITPNYNAPAPARSAPTYSAPTYTPPLRGNSGASPAPAPVSRAPVVQAPVSRAEPRQAGPPSNVSPDRARGRRD
jgi:hypothetical protein